MRIARPMEEALADHTFPTTTGALIAEHGDVEFTLPDGTVTLQTMLSHVPDSPLESPEEARHLVWGSFSDAAIGRKGYSDRDPPGVGDTQYDQVSL